MYALKGFDLYHWAYSIPNRYDKLLQFGLILLVGLLAFGATAYRINRAPDIFTDEIIYTRIGVRISGEGALVWDSGEPFMVHPPLYFLLEGIYFTLTNNRDMPIFATGDIFDLVYHARYINVFLAAVTAIFLYLLGKRLSNRRIGLLLAVIFILDPFGVRINRRAMLETLAMMLSLAGVYVFLGGDEPGTRKINSVSNILAGLLFGASLLAKELAFTNLIVVLLFAGFQSVHHRIEHPQEKNHFTPFYSAGVVIVIAILTYCIYPLWALSSSTWGEYLEEKFSGVERLMGLLQLTGWNRPGISFISLLLQRLADYGSSYLLLALGGLATIGLFLWGRRTWRERFLLAWGLVLYPFFTFVALVGSGNDQFFYFLLVPAMILVGYAAALLPSRALTWLLVRFPRLQLPERHANIVAILPLAALLAVILPFNAYVWISRYVVEQDNGYAQLTGYVDTTLPPDVPLNASGDPIKFRYFMPDRPIISVSTPDQAMASGVHYFTLAPKDAQLRYGNSSPELADWIQANGEQLYSIDSHTYGTLYLYYVDYAENGVKPVVPVQEQEQGKGAHWRSFQPAEGGFVSSLYLAGIVWGLLWSLIILRLSIHFKNETISQPQPFTPEEWVKLSSGQPQSETPEK